MTTKQQRDQIEEESGRNDIRRQYGVQKHLLPRQSTYNPFAVGSVREAEALLGHDKIREECGIGQNWQKTKNASKAVGRALGKATVATGKGVYYATESILGKTKDLVKFAALTATPWLYHNVAKPAVIATAKVGYRVGKDAMDASVDSQIFEEIENEARSCGVSAEEYCTYVANGGTPQRVQAQASNPQNEQPSDLELTIEEMASQEANLGKNRLSRFGSYMKSAASSGAKSVSDSTKGIRSMYSNRARYQRIQDQYQTPPELLLAIGKQKMQGSAPATNPVPSPTNPNASASASSTSTPQPSPRPATHSVSGSAVSVSPTPLNYSPSALLNTDYDSDHDNVRQYVEALKKTTLHPGEQKIMEKVLANSGKQMLAGRINVAIARNKDLIYNFAELHNTDTKQADEYIANAKYSYLDILKSARDHVSRGNPRVQDLGGMLDSLPKNEHGNPSINKEFEEAYQTAFGLSMQDQYQLLRDSGALDDDGKFISD